MKPSFLKMLIVEDDPMIGELIQDFFAQTQRYEFHSAADGREAFEKAKKELPDIIITDLMLPKMSGIELIVELRKMDEFAVTPILVVTAGNYAMQEQAKGAGASLIIPKPFSGVDLLHKVDMLVAATPFVRKR